MENGVSRSITTNQLGPHEKVSELVKRHLSNTSQKPYNQHTVEAFEQAKQWLASRDNSANKAVILDSCCGVGQSTAIIASRYPDALVIGLDKSALRTDKHQHYAKDTDNYVVIRADVNDFWRLAVNDNWKLFRHFLLYPNPYPKSAHVQRRWHACAAFKELIELGGVLEVRSNWDIYIQEFAQALTIAGKHAEVERYQSAQPDTPFERKYWASGQSSWRVVSDLNTTA